MKTQKIWCLVLGTISGAFPYWSLAYGETELFGSSILVILGVLSFLSSVLVGFLKEMKRTVLYAIYLASGVLAGCFSRILYDVIFVDSTHHNLWPIELLTIAIVAFPTALAGLYLTFYAKKMFASQ